MRLLAGVDVGNTTTEDQVGRRHVLRTCGIDSLGCPFVGEVPQAEVPVDGAHCRYRPGSESGDLPLPCGP